MTATSLQTDKDKAVLRVENLKVVFGEGRRSLRRTSDRGVHAVDGVTLEVAEREIVGVVGESGSGKTTLALAALRLIPITAGRVIFRGSDVTQLTAANVRAFRRHAVMIFQDPHSSLSPRMRVSSLLVEPYAIHRVPDEDRYTVPELLELVELPSRLADAYPHELSGGQARRVGIARGLALKPRLIVADEPTAGLDVSAASGILNLLQSLRELHSTSFMVITHALNVVGYLATTTAVMYLGKMVERGPADSVYDNPLHPYTRALMASIPDVERAGKAREGILSGEIPSPRNPPSGCRFHTRCPFAVDRCRSVEPNLEEASVDRWVACHRWRELAQATGPSRERTG